MAPTSRPLHHRFAAVPLPIAARQGGFDYYSAATTSACVSLSGCARRVSISFGQTCQNWPCQRSQSARTSLDHLLPVALAWSSTSSFSTPSQCAEARRCQSKVSGFSRFSKVRSASWMKAEPPVKPAPKLSPVAPRITTVPPVMYSQALAPVPSTTAVAPAAHATAALANVDPNNIDPKRCGYQNESNDRFLCDRHTNNVN